MSKPRKLFSDEQKLQYAKMVVEEAYSIIKVATIANARTSAVGRWKRQYLKKKQGITPTTVSALSPEHQEIQGLKKSIGKIKKG